MRNMETWLEHNGVKGMRWGRRKNGVSTAKVARGPVDGGKLQGKKLPPKESTAKGKAAIKNTFNKPKLEFDKNWADGIDPKDAAMMKKFIEDEYYGNLDVRML